MADTPEGAGPTPPPAPPTPPKPAVPKVDPVEAALRAEVPSAALDSLKRAHPDAVQEVTWYAGATTVVVPGSSCFGSRA